MLSMRRVGRIATLITTGVLIAGAPSAHANDRDLRATTVPATSCQPSSHAAAAEVSLVNAAWVFSNSNTGTVTFYCPVPVNGNTESDTTNDNDVSAFRVFYQDSDGTGDDAEVTVRLVYRNTGMFAAGTTWSSNVSNTAVDTMAFHSVAHDMSASALYSFIVTLRRDNATEIPVFTGIDFAIPPIP